VAALLLAEGLAPCDFAPAGGLTPCGGTVLPVLDPMSMFKPARVPRALLAATLLLALPGCRRTEAEYQKLAGENAYLRTEIERLTQRQAAEKTQEKEGVSPGKPDLNVTLVDLWSQRFDDNEFRARQRLSGKLIRLTGAVDGVAADSISIAGESKRFGGVHMTVNLAAGYALRIRDGLAALERRSVVTVQGKFNYERMILTEAVFVDQAGGRTLYADDLLALSAGIPLGGAPRPSAIPKAPGPVPVKPPGAATATPGLPR